jgi:hypothetical protein
MHPNRRVAGWYPENPIRLDDRVGADRAACAIALVLSLWFQSNASVVQAKRWACRWARGQQVPTTLWQRGRQVGGDGSRVICLPHVVCVEHLRQERSVIQQTQMFDSPACKRKNADLAADHLRWRKRSPDVPLRYSKIVGAFIQKSSISC